MPDLSPKTRPGLWQLFATFLIIGIQSFGGGSSTLILIQRACNRYGWLDDGDLVRLWALVQIAPGVNLIKLTILIGRRLRGWAGLVATSAGLLLPSAVATALMTAGFTAIHGQPLVQAAMRGILPATIGLSLAMAVQMAQPLFSQASREGRPRLAMHLVILVGSALLMAAGGGISPLVVLLAAGAAALLVFAFLPSKPEKPVTGPHGDAP